MILLTTIISYTIHVPLWTVFTLMTKTSLLIGYNVTTVMIGTTSSVPGWLSSLLSGNQQSFTVGVSENCKSIVHKLCVDSFPKLCNLMCVWQQHNRIRLMKWSTLTLLSSLTGLLCKKVSSKLLICFICCCCCCLSVCLSVCFLFFLLNFTINRFSDNLKQ